MIRYLTALITATLAGLAGVWLVLAPAALNYPGPGVYGSVPARVSLYTGAGLCAVAVLTAVCWAGAWRRRLRAEGVLPGDTTEAGSKPPRGGRDRRGAVRAKPGLPEGEPGRDAGADPAAKRGRGRSGADRTKPASPQREQARRGAGSAKRPAKGKRSRQGAVPPEAATTGPLPAVPVSTPVRLEDHELQALLAPRLAALNGDEEPKPAAASSVARSAKPFDDAPGRRAGWRNASLADDDAEETW